MILKDKIALLYEKSPRFRKAVDELGFFFRKYKTKLGNWIADPLHRYMAVALTLLFIYIAGVIAQFINNRYGWIAGGQLRMPSLNPFKGLAILTTPFGLQAVTGLTIFCLLLFLLYHLYREDRGHLKYDKKRNFYYTTKGTYGTAGWMEDDDIPKCFEVIPESEAESATGMIYGVKDGMLICRKSATFLNSHVAVFGASGSMKSRTYARNRVIAAVRNGESLVISDPKGELTADLKSYLEDNGYYTGVLNLVRPQESDRFYSLDGILDDPLFVETIVETVIANTGGTTGKGDPFFEAAEANLLSALIFYVMENQNGELPTLSAAFHLLLQTRTCEELIELFDDLPRDSRASMSFSFFRKSSQAVQGNIQNGLGARLKVLQNEEIAEVMSYPDLDFLRLGKEKCAYFLILSDQDTTMRFASAMFFSLLFIRLVRYADYECPGKKLPIPVHLLLDEYPNIGSINAFHIKLSTIRSRNISVSILFQLISQLQNRHPDNLWAEVLGNCDTQIFLGCGSDEITAEHISNRSGEVSIAVDTVMKQRNTFLPTEMAVNYRQSEGVGRRKLLTPDEVQRLEPLTMLIMLRGEKMLELEKFDYTRDPESKKFRPIKVEGVMAKTPHDDPICPDSEQPEQAPPVEETPEREPSTAGLSISQPAGKEVVAKEQKPTRQSGGPVAKDYSKVQQPEL